MVQTTLRALWALHLLLTFVVGPRFCPCAIAVAHGGPARTSEAAGQGPMPRCQFAEPCCAVRFEPEAQHGEPSDQPYEPCECRREPSDVVPPRPPARALVPEFPSDLEFSEPAVHLLLGFAGNGTGARSPSRGASPFLTTDIILYVFHILRC